MKTYLLASLLLAISVTLFFFGSMGCVRCPDHDPDEFIEYGVFTTTLEDPRSARGDGQLLSRDHDDLTVEVISNGLVIVSFLRDGEAVEYTFEVTNKRMDYSYY